MEGCNLEGEAFRDQLRIGGADVRGLYSHIGARERLLQLRRKGYASSRKPLGRKLQVWRLYHDKSPPPQPHHEGVLVVLGRVKLASAYYQGSDVVALSQDLLGKHLYSAIGGVITGGRIIET